MSESVSKWSSARDVFAAYAPRFMSASRYEEASAIADKAAREIDDLYAAPPPAEAPPMTVEEVARVIAEVRGYDRAYSGDCADEYHEKNGPSAYTDEAQAIVRMAEKGGARSLSRPAEEEER